MPKINTYELLKILVWFLSLSNIFREQHEHFLGPFWRNFYLGHFQNDSEGSTNPHFKFKWNLNMMHKWLASIGHTRLGTLQLAPTWKNLVPRFRGWRKEGGVLQSKTIFLLPSSFSLGMMRPLNFEKLDVLTSGNTLCLIKNANRVLSVCEVILEIKCFVVHSPNRTREATPELRNMEDIMNSGKMRRYFQKETSPR